MVVRNGSLAGHAGAHANNIDTFAFLQKKPGLCSKYTHKNRKLADIVQRLFVLNYVFALLLLSVRSCHSGQQQQQQQSGCERDARHGINLNPWSQYVVYAKILNNGRATQPPTWTNTRGAENLKQPHRNIICLMAILLLAGDVQLNPGPRLASAGDLLPSLGALDFPPALAMPPSASGGVYGGCLLRRGDSGGEWSGLAASSWLGSGAPDVALFSGADARCAVPALDVAAVVVGDLPRVLCGERSCPRTSGSGEFRTLTAPPSQENRSNQTANPVKQPFLNRQHWGLNPAIRKNRRINFFKTLNHAKLIWDPQSKPKGLLGGHLNIRSIVSKSNQLEHLLSHSNLDFLGLSETWLNKHSPEAAFDISGYNVFRRDRNKGKGGGLLVYVKNTITCNLIEWSQEIDMEYIGLNMSLSPQMSFIVICLYRPPSTNNIFYEHLHNILKQCDGKKELILMGDFNINWDKKTERKKLKEITNKFNLSQLIQGPTRITNSSQTQTDLIFTNRPQRVTTSHNLLTGLSDHNITLLVRKLTRKKLQNRPQEINSMRKFLKMKQSTWKKL